MDEILGMCQDSIKMTENISRPAANNEIEAVIVSKKNLPWDENPTPDSFASEFCKNI